MRSTRARLDRLISAGAGVPRRAVRLLLAQGRVRVDGELATAINQTVDQFSTVQLDDQVLQAKTPVYVMLHKPAGVVSATRDRLHPTVIGLLPRADRSDLHIVGRLDFNSSGLLLLTNDGHWSRRLSTPGRQVAKRYRVTLDRPVGRDCMQAFKRGMYFAYEGQVTRPAGLRLTGERCAEVSLTEGRYHQIKRMFGRFGIRVLTLHRYAVGQLLLDPDLQPGQSRDLTTRERETIDR